MVCLASGPSLTADDVEAVKAWRKASENGRGVIVVNTTFRLAPWADALFAMDRAWWLAHLAETTTFEGVRYTSCVLGHRSHGIDRVPKPFDHYGNSGAGAIALARKGGAAKVVLLGYDCQRTDGKAHWHADHPKGLGNAGSLPKWPKRFAELAAAFKDIEIVNCSRETALTCFPREDLSAVLDS